MPAISSAKGGRKLTFVGKDVHIDKPQYNLLGEGKTIPIVLAYHYADLVNSDACIAADGWIRTREGAYFHPYLYVITALRHPIEADHRYRRYCAIGGSARSAFVAL